VGVTFGAEFLASREALPEEHVGEPWGERAFGIAFPAGPYLVRGLTPGQEARIASHFADVRAEAGAEPQPAVEVTLRRTVPGAFRDVRLLEYRFDLESDERAVRVAGWGFMALLEPGERRRVSIWMPEAEPADLETIVSNLVRVAVAYRLLARGGAMIHSACVAKAGRAHLLLGHSGAGKSTISALAAAEGMTVLSDDVNVLERREDGFVVSRMPFAGDFGRTRIEGPPSVPLAALYRLEKGPAVRVRPLGRAEAAGLVVSCAPFVNADPACGERLLSTAIALAAAVPCRALAFPKCGPVGPVFEEEVRR
jgi:hypothetical protein